MKNIKILSLLVCLVAVLVGCSKEDEEGPVKPQPREQVGRTVLVYIVGDAGDPRNELSDLFETNLADMKEGMREVDYSKCNLVVYSELVDDVPHLVSLKKKDNEVVADTLFTYAEQNPLAKDVMSAVISQTISYFPADSYGMVFLSHSSSWVPASNDANSRSIGYYRKTQMNITDFRDVLLNAFPEPLKFLLFDSCNMQSVEVAYELRNCVEYFIGSPTEIPGPGAPYKMVVPELFTDTDLAVNIASAYYDYYDRLYTGERPTSNENWTGGVAASVINSAALENLAMATKAVIHKYVQNVSELRRDGILLYDFSSSRANYDFNDFIQNLTGGEDNSDYRLWRQAFDEAVIYRKTTLMNYSGILWRMFSMKNSEGLSTYIPEANDLKMNDFFHTLQWYSAAGWDETGW